MTTPKESLVMRLMELSDKAELAAQAVDKAPADSAFLASDWQTCIEKVHADIDSLLREVTPP